MLNLVLVNDSVERTTNSILLDRFFLFIFGQDQGYDVVGLGKGENL